jgi:TRAP-type mannitol/chloroaromatic compound transport system permease small subunit
MARADLPHGVVAVIGRVSGFFGAVAAVLCLAMIGVVFFDVVARYAFRGGSLALQELEWHLFAAMFLLGAAYAMREDAHVRVDVFYAHMSVRRRALVDLVGTLCLVLPVCTVILFGSVDFVGYAYSIGEGSPDPGGLPYRFIIKAALPLGYALVVLQSLAVVIRCVETLATREDRP